LGQISAFIFITAPHSVQYFSFSCFIKKELKGRFLSP